jgi:hypothetical protein
MSSSNWLSRSQSLLMIDESFVLPEPQLQTRLLNFNRYQSDDERIEFDKLHPTSSKQNEDCGWFFGLFNPLHPMSSSNETKRGLWVVLMPMQSFCSFCPL